MPADSLVSLATTVGERLRARGLTMVTAESCTGGWVAQAITAISGSSNWFDRAWVSYSNRAKSEMLGVPEATIAAHGAVSEPTVLAMVEGALARSAADIAVAVSGVAGPDGGTPDKPVGTVWIAWRHRTGRAVTRTERFSGDREAVRRQAVELALAGIVSLLEEPPPV